MGSFGYCRQCRVGFQPALEPAVIGPGRRTVRAGWKPTLRGWIPMRFPLSLTTTMVGYIAKKKITRQQRFPLVLMLEPLHACNLTCTGCGRIREYETSITQTLTLEKCLGAVDECGAPMVAIC